MSNSFFREDAQAGIFEPFGRLHERPLHIEGAGIGLSICRQLMELMDGISGVSSEPGSGSTFWIRVKGADGRPEPSLDNTRPHRADREQLVLYVEDSPSHVRLVHHIIDLMGDVRLVAARWSGGGRGGRLRRSHPGTARIPG